MRTRRLLLIPLLLALPTALSGCATTTQPPVLAPCPQLPPVPTPLMQPPPKPLQTAQQLRSLLFEQVTQPTHASSSSASR